MQTFLPTDYAPQVATYLDNKRLHKQALEGYQILMVLTELAPDGSHRTPKGWVNHPAVKMWRGYEAALVNYILCMVEEWKKRGFNSTLREKVLFIAETAGIAKETFAIRPPWMYNTALIARITSSHRTALLSKDYEWYSRFDWPEDTGTRPESYEYVWPVE